MKKRYVIVGGVAGGATVAARLRRLDEEAEIIIFEKGNYISYANCGLPYYIGGIIEDRNKLLVQTPESFKARFNVDIRVSSEVLDIDRENHKITVKDYQKNLEYTEAYDKLILSTGALPVKPPIPGIDSEGIFTLRDVKDTDTIKTFIDNQKPQRAVVVGAGFIGLEMAENLYHQNIQVTVVEAAPQVMNMLDPEIAASIHMHFKEKNIALYLSDAVKEFKKHSDGTLSIHLNTGENIECDMVILSIGVKPNTELAQKAKLDIGEARGIKVNEYLQTSDQNIYAVGDSIEYPHAITRKSVITYLAGPANHQARVLADNLVKGHHRKYKGAIGTAIAKVFDLTVASTGLSDKQLSDQNIPHISTIVHVGSHAGYYPGALSMMLKISFDPETGKLYGGQIVGYKGVDKRIDIIATVIGLKGTIYDLQEVEHAYAPPYSSAKDPVQQVAYNAANIIEGLFKPMSPQCMKEDTSKGTLLDVRTASEYALGSIPGALNIEVDKIRENIDKIPTEKPLYVFCGIGLRGYVATRVLMQHGFKEVYNLSGGFKTYNAFSKEQNHKIDPISMDKDNSNLKEFRTDPIENSSKQISVDACGLQCPGPIMKLKEEIDYLKNGDTLSIVASDAGFYNDVKSWCEVTGNTLQERSSEKGVVKAIITKGATQKNSTADCKAQTQNDNKTLVVFSDDMDKALASFVIANGAAAMGKEVTLFFTFWGLNVIKDPSRVGVNKDTMGKMFEKMMPKGASKLKLSNMNMGGLGTKMMKKRMQDKKVDSLEIMIQKAINAGVKLIACQMSMDIMGVTAEELLPNVEIGGVANYLAEAEKANVNLFI